jgi:hypothetical protein
MFNFLKLCLGAGAVSVPQLAVLRTSGQIRTALTNSPSFDGDEDDEEEDDEVLSNVGSIRSLVNRVVLEQPGINYCTLIHWHNWSNMI